MHSPTGLGRGWVRFALAAAVVVAGAEVARADHDDDRDDDGGPKAVYSLTNEPSGNRLAVFRRDRRGRLAPVGMVPTGGRGTGGGLSNQGALAFGDDRRSLYAVNPGDGTITVFALTSRGPFPIQRVASHGSVPVSLAVRKDRLYVLNAGGANHGGVDSIAGFRIGFLGLLGPLPGSIRPLSAASTGPAQVGFDDDGDLLIVTERATDRITTFALDHLGRPGLPRPMDSAGATPFGFEVHRDGFLIVSEAFGGAPGAGAVSSYEFDRRGRLEAISESIPTEQTAACWIAITRDGDYAYTTNTGSSTVTGYSVDRRGRLSRLDDDGVTADTGGASPTDMALLKSEVLYVLNSRSGGIGVFEIGRDGSLLMIQNLEGVLPSTVPTGLLVR